MGFDVRTDDRSLGASWPRRLGFQRPINSGDIVGRMMEYPLGADEYELPCKLDSQFSLPSHP